MRHRRGIGALGLVLGVLLLVGGSAAEARATPHPRAAAVKAAEEVPA